MPSEDNQVSFYCDQQLERGAQSWQFKCSFQLIITRLEANLQMSLLCIKYTTYFGVILITTELA